MSTVKEAIAPTPGPWIVDENGFVYAEPFIEMTTLVMDDGTEKPYKRGLIALPYSCGPTVGSADANACLIAAAPDLLASCRELRDALAGAMRVLAWESDALTEQFVEDLAALGIPNGIGVRADAAIQKAEGK